MKHLLILLSILLLSSPVIGDNHKVETLYLWETSFGIEWKKIGNKNSNLQYEGEVKDGKPHGQGTWTLPNGIKYVREFKYGLPNGQGTWTSPDEEKYVGEYKDGKRHGQGTFTLLNGGKYEGEFRDNMEWNGIFYYKNGNIALKVVNGKPIKQ